MDTNDIQAPTRLGAGLRRFERPIVLAGAAVLLLSLIVPPFASVALQLGSAGFDSLQALLGARALVLLGSSLSLAAGCTLVATAIGAPLGILLGRCDVAGRRAAWLLHAFGMFLPPFLLGLGWFYWFAPNGIIGSAAGSRILFGPIGVVLVLGLAFAPIVSSLVGLAAGGIDPALVEAARTLAHPLTVARRMVFGAVRPAIALSAIIVFALAFAELGVPTLLRVEVYPAAVFARLGALEYAPGEAALLSLPLIPIAALLVAIERRAVDRRAFALLGRRAHAGDLLPLGRARRAASIAVWIVVSISQAPLIALATRAAGAGGGPAAISEWAGSAPANGAFVSAIAASIVALLAFPLGYAAARSARGAAELDAISLFAFVAPAAVLGAGSIALWNRPATSAIYQTPAILVAAFVSRYAIAGVRASAAIVMQIPALLEDAAAAAGAGFIRRMTRIVLPLAGRGVAAAWLLTFVFCLRDLETAVLIYPAGGEPLAVRIFTLEANGPEAAVATLALLQVAITGVATGLGALVMLRGTDA